MKKNILKILALIMMVLSIRGIFLIMTDTDFSFTGFPMSIIYLILSAVILVTVVIVWLAFIKQNGKN